MKVAVSHTPLPPHGLCLAVCEVQGVEQGVEQGAWLPLLLWLLRRAAPANWQPAIWGAIGRAAAC